MNSLPGRGVADGISLWMCADKHGRAELKTSDTGCEMPLFIPRSDNSECGSGLPVNGIAGEQKDCAQMRVSPVQSRFLLGHCFGAIATPGGGSLFCFGCAAYRLRFPSAMDPP